jgi:mono/diheme cytochrome c family protein
MLGRRGGGKDVKKLIGFGAAAAIALLAVIQLVPYGRDHRNPPVENEPAWDAPRTRALFFTACRNCHSNETEWPWYASVAPASWLVYHDVQEGRSHFNVSRWGRGKQDADEAAGQVRRGEMPPWYYLAAHPEARLDEAAKRELIRGLVATFGDESEREHEHEHAHGHERDAVRGERE